MKIATQSIINKPVSLTNEMLYNLCQNKGKYVWGKGQFLGEKIWLIGRSYAASPERRYVKNPNVSGKLQQNNPGNGTGRYFSEVGTYIVKDSRYGKLISLIGTLQSRYRFDGGQGDMNILNAAIEAVELLNEIVKDASEDYDNRYNPNLKGNVTYKNQISFCSKFLHFHCPHTVFIIDHFTKEAASRLFSLRSQKILSINRTQITSKNKKDLQSYLPKNTNSFSNVIDDYAEHCKQSYALCCYINQNFKGNNTKNIVYFPRTVDNILQSIK